MKTKNATKELCPVILSGFPPKLNVIYQQGQREVINVLIYNGVYPGVLWRYVHDINLYPDAIQLSARYHLDMDNNLVSEDVETSTEVMEAVKHPLEDSWTIWLGTSNKNKWGQNIELTSFDTVEDFWCLHHHMKLPSELEKCQDYSIFKTGISPTWEDVANKNGGRWIINFDKRVNELNSNWVITILILIGATLEYHDTVCGAVVNVRTPKTKIGIWLKDASDQEAILSVGKDIKRHLGYRGGINFHKHNNNVNIFLI